MFALSVTVMDPVFVSEDAFSIACPNDWAKAGPMNYHRSTIEIIVKYITARYTAQAIQRLERDLALLKWVNNG